MSRPLTAHPIRPAHLLKARQYSLALKDKTLLMAVVNLTPDSFSKDGRLTKRNDPTSNVRFINKLIVQGAGIIDLGAESSRPGAKEISVKEELGRECVVDYIETLDNQFIFLPTMYYMEMAGDIKINEIYPDHRYFKVNFFLEKDGGKDKNRECIYIIECTKINKKTNEFVVYLNNDYDKGITLKLSTRYAKVLYNIAHKGKYEIETNIKSATGYIRNLNTKKRPVPSLLYSTMKNLKEKKIVRMVGRTIVATNDVVIRLK